MKQSELLKRQHKEILDLINEIENNIKDKNKNQNENVVKLINSLSGKLKVHLSIEDKHLYPELLNSTKYREIAFKYMDEMGNLVNEYNSFKTKFNTPSKLALGINEFEKESEKVFYLLRNRIIKEDNELYQLCAEQN